MDIKISENNDYIIIQNRYQIKIVGTYDFPYFCAEDICYMLGHLDMEKSLQKYVGLRQKKIFSEFDENECTIGIPHFYDVDIAENSIYVNILGFFHLAYYMNSPKAEEYQDAIFEDIFPAIREHENQDLLKQIKNINNKLSHVVNLIADLVLQ